MNRIITLLFCCSIYTTAPCAILIESIDDDGKTGRVTIDEGRARIDADTLGGYILVNLDDATIYAVNHKERALMDLRSPRLSSHHSEGKDNIITSSPPVEFKRMGKGPVIAGYETIRYQVKIDGMYCFDEYLSEQLLTYPNIKRFVEIIGESTGTDSNSGMGIPFDTDAPCESADDLADDYYAKFGVPMRTVGSNGLISHEISRINFDAKPPAGTFAAPPGYKQVSRKELIDRSADNIPAHSGISNLNNEDILKMQEQIKKQIEIMKKRHGESKDDSTSQ